MTKGFKYKLELTVFICGAITMILELVGSRVVAPYFGSSLFVWTGLIGVILGCMSYGYYLGGRLSDNEKASTKTLSLIILFAGFFIGLSAFIKEPLLALIARSFTDIRVASLLSVLLLFGVSSVLLAMISPYSAKIKLVSIGTAGTTVGKISSLSTAGSIVGTFAAGFLLIPFFGNSKLLYIMAFSLLLLSILLERKLVFLWLSLLAIVCLFYYFNFFLNVNKLAVLADIDSQYNRIIIGREMASGDQELITLRSDNSGIQTAVYADGSDKLVAGYLQFFEEATTIKPTIKNVLMIGGAGFSYPRRFLSQYKEAKIDVVEIDPKMIEIAKQYFFLKDDERLKIFPEDARIFARHSDSARTYDAVYLDAFNSLAPPYHLTTQEFFLDLNKSLNENGFVVLNLISSLEGDNSLFLKSEYATLSSIFPKVEVYQLNNKENLFKVQNIGMVAYKNSKDSLHKKTYRLYSQSSPVILTDDHAPVEYLTSGFSGV